MEFKPDSIVSAIVNRFTQRAKFGKEKYGTTLDRKDLKVPEWLQHLQDELHDAYLYSEKLKISLEKQERLLELALNELQEVEAHQGVWYTSTKLMEEFDRLKEWYKEHHDKNKRTEG